MGNELLRASTGPRDWLVGQLTRMFGDNRTAAEYANKAADAFDYTGAGAVTTGAYEGGNALARMVKDPSKQNVLAAGLTAATMLPFIKGIRGAARGAAQEAASTANMGIRAFHGSPHDFERFDTAKIGTGQGDQTYGHGHYLAENEAVAQGYRPEGGHMYEADIGSAPEHFVELGKPVHQQSPYVQEALKKIPDEGFDEFSPEGAMQMHQAGIAGLRYLDAGSREAGKGTHNYVVFDPHILSIIRKYGVLPFVGAGIAASGGQSDQVMPPGYGGS